MMSTSSIWFDNFDQFCFSSMPSLANKPWRGGSWTGCAVHKYAGPEISMDLVYRGDGSLVLAQPNTFEELLEQVAPIQAAVAADERAAGRKILRGSLIKKFKVMCVPVRPVVDRTTHPAEHDLLKAARHHLSDLAPISITPDDIGSNFGLSQVMKRFHDEWLRAAVRRDRYFFMYSDMNIFWRQIKVCASSLSHTLKHSNWLLFLQMLYGRTRLFPPVFRAQVSVMLANWHGYKYMVIKVFQVFLLGYFGPLQHHLHPGFKLLPKPHLRTCTTYLLWMVTAYKGFKRELATAIAEPGMRGGKLNYLINLRDLCEFFIPTVEFHTHAHPLSQVAVFLKRNIAFCGP